MDIPTQTFNCHDGEITVKIDVLKKIGGIFNSTAIIEDPAFHIPISKKSLDKAFEAVESSSYLSFNHYYIFDYFSSDEYTLASKYVDPKRFLKYPEWYVQLSTGSDASLDSTLKSKLKTFLYDLVRANVVIVLLKIFAHAPKLANVIFSDIKYFDSAIHRLEIATDWLIIHEKADIDYAMILTEAAQEENLWSNYLIHFYEQVRKILSDRLFKDERLFKMTSEVSLIHDQNSIEAMEQVRVLFIIPNGNTNVHIDFTMYMSEMYYERLLNHCSKK